MLFDLISKGVIGTKPDSIKKKHLDDAVKMLNALAQGKMEYARVLLLPHQEI